VKHRAYTLVAALQVTEKVPIDGTDGQQYRHKTHVVSGAAKINFGEEEAVTSMKGGLVRAVC
jgi:hypothetical protein